MALLTFDLTATFPTGGGIAGSLEYESEQAPAISNERSGHSYATYLLTSWSMAVVSGTSHLPDKTFSNSLSGHIAEFRIGTCIALCADEVIRLRLFDGSNWMLQLAWTSNYDDFLTRPPSNASEWGSFRQSSYRVWQSGATMGGVPILVFSDGALTLAA